ncbi:hypothetical protein [Amycolatopsis sp. NBC_00438]|uniref:hypothetical protein n=1 Tax=Amycolatopsis sp. NBC_00438 TaxID=2903558 RepID=UPI002E1AAB86
MSQIDSASFEWSGGTEEAPISFTATRSEEGEGFGLTEVLTIVISIGSSAASDLVADAVRRGLRGIIRRVRSADDQSDGSADGIAKLVDRQRGAQTDVGAHVSSQKATEPEPQEPSRDV